MVAAKGYGLTPENIDWSSPADMEPYIKAHNAELKEKDRVAWLSNQYTLSAVLVAIERNLAGRKAKSKYIEKPILEFAEEQEYAKKNDRPEYKGMTAEEKQKSELAKAKSYFNSLMARFPN